VARVLHPVDVQIIEALQQIGEPLSAGDLTQLFDDEVSWAVMCRHMQRLTKLNAIELGETPTIRNVADISYRLVLKRDSDGC
jgi:hypothetical protein